MIRSGRGHHPLGHAPWRADAARTHPDRRTLWWHRHFTRRLRRRDHRLGPSRHLHDLLGVTHETDFTWSDPAGTALHDPSATSGGPATLAMRRDLLPLLTSAGLTLFWTVLIGNELQNTDPLSHPGSDYRWVSASASYVLSGDTINLVSAAAAHCAPGPETEQSIEWTRARPTTDASRPLGRSSPSSRPT